MLPFHLNVAWMFSLVLMGCETIAVEEDWLQLHFVTNTYCLVCHHILICCVVKFPMLMLCV